MQIRLAENIRALRRQHRFTQEQLAESLGVTPGAVYKWEAGLSQPELAIIVELSDLFDTSVDVLLGYEMKDNRRQTTADRLRRCQTEKDRTGLAEAEKALQKYPNDFEIVESDRDVAHAAADRRGLRPAGCAAAGAAGMDHRRVYPAGAALMLLKYASEPRFIEKAMRQYKDFAFQKLTEKSISSFRAESTAAYLSALTNDAASIEADDLSQLLSVITKAVTFFGALAMMLWYSLLMTAIAAGVTVLPLIASLLTGGQLQAAEKRVSDQNRDFTAALSDCLGGFSVVKTFRAEKEIFRLFAESNRALEQEKFSRRRLKALVGMIGATTGVIAQLGVFLAGAYLALTGKGLTAGAVILFVNLMNFMIEPVAELPALLAARKAARGLIAKLADALEQDEVQPDGVQIAPLMRQLRLEDVRFSYDGETEILRGVSAVFDAGKAYAIVGASGSGKSTLLNLLTTPGMAYAGKILLDGTELRTVSPESLYETMSCPCPALRASSSRTRWNRRRCAAMTAFSF